MFLLCPCCVIAYQCALACVCVYVNIRATEPALEPARMHPRCCTRVCWHLIPLTHGQSKRLLRKRTPTGTAFLSIHTKQRGISFQFKARLMASTNIRENWPGSNKPPDILKVDLVIGGGILFRDYGLIPALVLKCLCSVQSSNTKTHAPRNRHKVAQWCPS